MAINIYGLTDANFVGPLNGAKCQHDLAVSVDQTGTVVAATRYLCVIRGINATLLQLAAVLTEAIATGGDRTITINLYRSTGGGAFASIMTALVLNNGNTLLIPVTGALTTTALVAGDVLKLTVAVAGAAGAQATGLLVTLTRREDPS